MRCDANARRGYIPYLRSVAIQYWLHLSVCNWKEHFGGRGSEGELFGWWCRLPVWAWLQQQPCYVVNSRVLRQFWEVMMSAEGSKQGEQTVTGKHAGTENVCNDIMKALSKPQGFPWCLNCCNIDECLRKSNTCSSLPSTCTAANRGNWYSFVNSQYNYWSPFCDLTVLQNVITCCIHAFSFQLIQSPVTTPLGLIMLKTTSEELACPREDLSVARKEELRKLLLDQVQTVLGLLTGTSWWACSPETSAFLHCPYDNKPASSRCREARCGGCRTTPAVKKLNSTVGWLGQKTLKEACVAK